MGIFDRLIKRVEKNLAKMEHQVGDEEEVNVVTLENGIEYFEAARMEMDGNTYVFLCEDKDDSDGFCIRKLIEEDGEPYITGLKDRAEFDKALRRFAENMLQ